MTKLSSLLYFYFDNMNLRSFLKIYCKPFYCIWFGQRKDSWKKTRFCSSALTGTLCAWLMCKCLFASVLIPKIYEKVLLLLTISIVVSGYVFTDVMKCITLMTFVSMLDKSGRSYMRALGFAFIIAGPIENLAFNAGEIVRAFSCSKILAINLTRTRFDLMTKPFQKTLVNMKEDIRDVQNTFKELKDVTQVLHKEIVMDDQDVNVTASSTSFAADYKFLQETKTSQRSSLNRKEPKLNAEYYENQYRNKFKKRCLKQLENGKVRCEKAFSTALEKCYEKMPFIIKTLICWPFKVNFICKMNILGNPEKICDPSDAVPDNFGERYFELVGIGNELYEESSNVKVNFTILSPETMPRVKSAEETSKFVENEFKLRKRTFDSIFTILQQFLGFMVLRILYVCVKYYKMYKKDLDHDNIYVTSYFKHVDSERKSCGKQTLLPLKKYESRNLIDTDRSWNRTQEESQAVTFHLLQFSLEIVSGSFFLYLDYVVVSVLQIIRKNSKMTFVQEGEHTIKFQIHGSGLIARLLRNTMGNFNMHETVSTFFTNEMCLPNPTILPKSFYLKLFGLYIIVLILIYQSSSFLRTRRLICGYFNRKHEKRRILFLYNSLLKQRRTIRDAMIREAKYNFANRQIRSRTNLFLILRSKWPNCFNWLAKFHMGRRKCVICGELEDSKFVFCKNATCKVSYCNDCFNDIENACWICNDVLSVEIILNFNDFFEQFLFV